MCPATDYWQQKMPGIGDKIVNELKFDGIYFDQIGAIEATPCYDRSHNHSIGGGHYWQKGNSKLF